mgnify:CR=1 FL=1
MTAQRELIAPFVGDTAAAVRAALDEGKQVLLEGQLGTLKDPDFGIYPFVTSSSTLAGYGCVGAGIPPTAYSDIIAVTKAYSSAVGGGAFMVVAALVPLFRWLALRLDVFFHLINIGA